MITTYGFETRCMHKGMHGIIEFNTRKEAADSLELIMKLNNPPKGISNDDYEHYNQATWNIINASCTDSWDIYPQDIKESPTGKRFYNYTKDDEKVKVVIINDLSIDVY